jgi:hypothetical protein
MCMSSDYWVAPPLLSYALLSAFGKFGHSFRTFSVQNRRHLAYRSSEMEMTKNGTTNEVLGGTSERMGSISERS